MAVRPHRVLALGDYRGKRDSWFCSVSHRGAWGVTAMRAIVAVGECRECMHWKGNLLPFPSSTEPRNKLQLRTQVQHSWLRWHGARPATSAFCLCARAAGGSALVQRPFASVKQAEQIVCCQGKIPEGGSEAAFNLISGSFRKVFCGTMISVRIAQHF